MGVGTGAKTENRGSRAGRETSEVHLECIGLVGRRVVRTRGQMWDLKRRLNLTENTAKQKVENDQMKVSVSLARC